MPEASPKRCMSQDSEPSAKVKVRHLLANSSVRTVHPAFVSSGESDLPVSASEKMLNWLKRLDRSWSAIEAGMVVRVSIGSSKIRDEARRASGWPD